MGCGGSKKEAAAPAAKAAPKPVVKAAAAVPAGKAKAKAKGKAKGGGGGPVRVQAANPNDPPFMQTACPGGVSWGQYVQNGSSFIDPKSGFLAGPWAECISWAVVFEHNNDWGKMPQYAQDGVVGGVLDALEKTGKGQAVMDAAQRLEDASHLLADKGQALPTINQAVTLPSNAVPGQMCKIANPQAPGTAINIMVPSNASPGQTITAPAPIQPTKNGMSTGTKVAYVAGGALVVGAVAGAVYYGLEGGGVDGFVGDMGSAGDAIAGADYAGMAGDVGDFAADAGGAIGDGAGAAVDAVAGADYAGAVDDVGDFAADGGELIGDFGGDAMDTAGDFIMDLF